MAGSTRRPVIVWGLIFLGEIWPEVDGIGAVQESQPQAVLHVFGHRHFECAANRLLTGEFFHLLQELIILMQMPAGTGTFETVPEQLEILRLEQ